VENANTYSNRRQSAAHDGGCDRSTLGSVRMRQYRARCTESGTERSVKEDGFGGSPAGGKERKQHSTAVCDGGAMEISSQ
jgi:hypothetical protein